MAFQAQIVVPSLEELRTTRRRAVNFRAFVRETGARIFPADITNLSTDGCQIQCAQPLETATRIWLKIEGLGARQARIIWCEAGACGCEFTSPMRAEVVEELCANAAQRLRVQYRADGPGFGRAT